VRQCHFKVLRDFCLYVHHSHLPLLFKVVFEAQSSLQHGVLFIREWSSTGHFFNKVVGPPLVDSVGLVELLLYLWGAGVYQDF
jgi:hypothetical protein